jgi:hypothetical protein
MNINTTITSSSNNKSDLFGALASSLCMVHCLITPLIFVVQVCTASCCAPWWWRLIDYIFLVISIATIYYTAKRTSLQWMPKALYISWGVLAFLIFNEGLNWLTIPHVFVYLPAFSLVFLHLYNRKYCRCETKECCVTE